jgi:hypothetical protein
LFAANDVGKVTYRTIKAKGMLETVRRAAVDVAVRAYGGVCRWRVSERAARTYGLLELPSGRDLDNVAFDGIAVFDLPIIALAVFPAVGEALPYLLDALGGPGRPGGVLACDAIEGGMVVDWDIQRTPASVVMGAIDVELRRFHSGRTAELLAPLPPSWTAQIASDALRAPQVSEDRVLEELISRAGLHA